MLAARHGRQAVRAMSRLQWRACRSRRRHEAFTRQLPNCVSAAVRRDVCAGAVVRRERNMEDGPAVGALGFRLPARQSRQGVAVGLSASLS